MKIYKVFILVIFSFSLISCGSSVSEEIKSKNDPAEITNKQNNKMVQSVIPTPVPTSITILPTSDIRKNSYSLPVPTPEPTSITLPLLIPTPVPTSITLPLPISTPEPTPIPTITPIPTATQLPIPEKMTNTDSNCEDRKDYVYCTSSEAIVAPFTQLDSESGWGVEKGYSPEVFCASDLQETVCPAVTSALLAAMIEWGSYEPVEYWVLGAEKEAASKLTNINCKRRQNRGQLGMVDCLGQHGPDSGGLDFYRRIGEEAIENNRVNLSVAHMGHDEWGFHFFGSSIPFGFTDLFQPIEGGNGQKIVFHEYFHAIQSSHKGVGEKRESLKGPDWFVEGGAEYMAEIKLKKAIDTKLLKPIYGSKPYVLRDNMEDHMLRAIDNLSNNCPGNKLQDLNYENQCDILYSLGSWAMAYLAHVYGEDLLLESFYKNLTEKTNWEVAFNDTYGISLEEFYVDFDKFLKLQGSDYDIFHNILGQMEYRILK